MLFYESSKCFHGRPHKFNGSWYSSVFVHYYPKHSYKQNFNDREKVWAIPNHWQDTVSWSAKEPPCYFFNKVKFLTHPSPLFSQQRIMKPQLLCMGRLLKNHPVQMVGAKPSGRRNGVVLGRMAIGSLLLVMLFLFNQKNLLVRTILKNVLSGLIGTQMNAIGIQSLCVFTAKRAAMSVQTLWKQSCSCRVEIIAVSMILRNVITVMI